MSGGRPAAPAGTRRLAWFVRGHALSSLAKAVLVAVVAALLATLAWVLAFAQLAVVPDGVSYPPNWPLLNPTAQNEWLLGHTVTLSGFNALVHMLKHYSELGWSLLSMLGLAFAAALCALGVQRLL